MILPSLREKKRFVVFEALTDGKISFKEVKEEIFEKLNNFLGKINMAKAGIFFLDDWENNRGIIRASNKFTDYVKAAFTQVGKINKYEVIVRSIGVSGILKKARNYL